MKKLFKLLKAGIVQSWFMILDLLTDKAQENGNVRKISLGRCCFLILFVVAINIWLGGADIAANMLIVMGSLLTYVFGSKVTEGWASLAEMKHATPEYYASKHKSSSKQTAVDAEEAGD